MAKQSLAVRTQNYSEWAVDFFAVSPPHQAPVTPVTRAAGRSQSPRAIPHHARAASHCMVSMATLSDESDHDAQLYLAGSSGLNASAALTSSDMCFLLSSSALSLIPCLGGCGSGLIFLSPVPREKAVSEL